MWMSRAYIKYMSRFNGMASTEEVHMKKKKTEKKQRKKHAKYKQHAHSFITDNLLVP